MENEVYLYTINKKMEIYVYKGKVYGWGKGIFCFCKQGDKYCMCRCSNHAGVYRSDDYYKINCLWLTERNDELARELFIKKLNDDKKRFSDRTNHKIELIKKSKIRA